MNKDIVMKFRVAKKLKDKVKKKAEKANMTISSYVYKILEKSNITVIEEGHNIYTELSKIGNNLNELAKKVNLDIAINKDFEELEDISKKIVEIRELLNSLMSK